MMKNREPMRVFEGNAKPFEPFWKIVNAAESESGESEIWFYGYISEFSWFGDEVTPGMFKADLDRLGGKPVTLRINSGGGEVFAASAIRAMIMDYKGRVTTRIDGLCASAATYVAMAGDVVKMQDSAFFMIHDPWTVAIGGVEDFKRAMELLKTVKNGIIETYQAKTQADVATLSRWMSNETWFSAQEALQNGFIDEVISEPTSKMAMEAAPMFAMANAVRSFERAPEELRKRMDEFASRPENSADYCGPAPVVGEGECHSPLQSEEFQEEAASSDPLLTENELREAQTLRERVTKILKKETEDA
jgi:ATP-dependent Clp protease protease subunit